MTRSRIPAGRPPRGSDDRSPRKQQSAGTSPGVAKRKQVHPQPVPQRDIRDPEVLREFALRLVAQLRQADRLATELLRIWRPSSGHLNLTFPGLRPEAFKCRRKRVKSTIGAPVSSAQHARDDAAFLQACAAYLAPVFPGPGFPVDTWCRCFLRYAESTPGSAANESSDDVDQIVSGAPDSDGIRGVGKWMGYYGTYSCYS
jgi:hypothetical protein